MPNPSLLIVPARFKTGRLYSQIPSNTDNRGDFNVTRATAATRVNSAGLIESVASGIPRLDYFASGGVVGCPALLVEPSVSNSALQSQDFTTTWSPTNVTVSANVTGTTDPFGTNLADLLTATASGSARVVQTFSFVSGTTYTYSCFAKAGSGFFGMTMENGGVASGVAVIWNLSTGAFSVSGSVGSGYTLQAHNIENYGNGWYRCSMRVLLGSTVAGNIRVNTSNGTMSSAIVQSDNGNTVNVFGAQLETGSVATSYIPTTTAAVTRNADLISLSSVSGVIGQTEGTIYWEGSLGQIDKIFFSIGASTTQTIRLETTSNGFIQFGVISGTPQCTIATSGAINIGQSYKVAGAYKQDDFVFYVNGQQVGVDNSGTIPTALAQMQFSSSATANLSIQRCRALALYTTRLTNAELAALTTL